MATEVTTMKTIDLTNSALALALPGRFMRSGASASVRILREIQNNFDVVFFPTVKLLTLNKSAEIIEALESHDLGVPSCSRRLALRLQGSPIYRLSRLLGSSLYQEVANEYKNCLQEKPDLLFDPDYLDPDVAFLSSTMKVNFGINVQSDYFSYDNLGIRPKRFSIAVSPGGHPCLLKLYAQSVAANVLPINRLRLSLTTDRLKFVSYVSYGALMESFLNRLAAPKIVIDPAYAVDFTPASRSKSDYALFFTSLTVSKGLLHLPLVLDQAKDVERLLVFGPYESCSMKTFLKIVKRYHLEQKVRYLGEIKHGDRFNEVVSRARVVIYPSLMDSFSMVILESIALGTPVVAYDLPGPKSVFGGLSAVRFVKTGDIKAMAQQANELYNMNGGDLRRMFEEESYRSFIERHSRWDAVVKSYLSVLYHAINY